MAESLAQLAREHNLTIDDELIRRIVQAPATRRSAAYYTYADWLIRRLEGQSDGPSILALWRIIAWDPRGGLRPSFEFRIEDVRAAEAALLTALQEA